MGIEQLKVGPMDNFSYLLWDEDSKDAAIIDPAWEFEKLEAAISAKGLRLKAALLTHAHPDHVNALHYFEAKYPGLPVYMHEADLFLLEQRPKNLKSAESSTPIEEGRLKAKVLHTPGHTPGSVCYLAEAAVFTGDTLFVGECGRVDLPGSSAEALYESLRALAELSPETVIYPGHAYNGGSSTIGAQKDGNLYLKLASKDKAGFLRAVI